MVKRLAVLAGVVLGVVLAGVAPAGAQQYPPADNRVTVSDACPVPGDTITVTARTFSPGANVAFALAAGGADAAGLGSAAADGSGVASLNVSVPDVKRGPATLTASGDSLDLAASITICPFEEAAEAAAPAAFGPAPTDQGQLPRTGSDLEPLQIGLVLAAFGGLLMALAAKRRRRAAQAEAAQASHMAS
jgi:hypothetical protein